MERFKTSSDNRRVNKSEGEKMKTKTLILTVLVLSILASIACIPNLVYAEDSDPAADSMWMEPSEVDVSGMSIHDKFNVTVWLNTTENVGSWQFYLIYDKAKVNVTRSGLTGTGGTKSQFFENTGTTTFVPPPSRGSHNSTHDYIQVGESWLSGPWGTGYGSLVWVEVEILAQPPFTCVLDIASAYHPPNSDTLVQKSDMSEVPLDVFNALIIPEFPSLILLLSLFTTSLIVLYIAKKKK
jgi:hypothetical protein